MRRAQKSRSWQRKPTFQRGPSWYPQSPLVYGCELPPKAKLAHKYLRILKRLIAGEKIASKVKGAWQWMKAGKWGGKVKATLLTGLRALGYIVNIGGQWCITSNGLQAVTA